MEATEYTDLFNPESVLFVKRSSGEPINLLAFDSALLSDTFRLCALLLNNKELSVRELLSCCISAIGLNTFGAEKLIYFKIDLMKHQ